MSLLFKQNKICRFHGVPHPQGTNCTGIDYDPSQEPAAQPEYEAAYHNDKDGTDAAGRAIDRRGKLIATRPVKKADVQFVGNLKATSADKKVEQKIETKPNGVVVITETVYGTSELPLIEKKPETKIVNSVAQPEVVEPAKEIKPFTKNQVLEDPIIPSEEEKSKD